MTANRGAPSQHEIDLKFDRALEIIKETRKIPKLSIAMKRELDRLEERIESESKSEVVLQDNYEIQAALKALLDYYRERQNDLDQKEDVLARFDQWRKQYPDAPAHLVSNYERNLELVNRNYETLEKKKQKRNNW